MLDEQRDVLIIVGILLAILILAGIFIPGLPHLKNLINVSGRASRLGIVSVGQTVAILVGGIDLSVGATISLVDVYATGFMANYTAPLMVTGMVVVPCCRWD